MKNEITYIAEKTESGKIIGLYRFWNDKFSHEEIFQDGMWKQNNSLVSVLLNLHNPAFVEINQQKAEAIIANLNPKPEEILQTV